jgi:mono/diheme cytochrome c family protein
MKRIKIILGTVIVLALLEFGALIGVIYSGVYDVAADSPDVGIIARIAEATREQSIKARAAKVEVPDLSAPETVQQGAQLYDKRCAACHLAPGRAATGVHRGMNPPPPEFSNWSRAPGPKGAFWVTAHGIKMTGMPAWGKTLSEQQIWSIVAFLQKIPKLTPEQYQGLVQTGGGPAAPSLPGPGYGTGGAPSG